MKKIILIALIFIGQLFALTANKQNILNLQKQHIPIVDIRLPSEWKATGTIPNAIKITFFDRSGNINKNFLIKLKEHNITRNSKFAIICRTGHRSRIATEILQNNGYKNIIDLKGGMFSLFKSLLKGLKNGK
jgi:rhodanese-related sulfurtransferase